MVSLGIDLGSSSVKIALVDLNSFENLVIVKFPKEEMHISSPQLDWAEQDPSLWWEYVCSGIKEAIEEASIDPKSIKSIGISYQMHGLVIVDDKGDPIRPSIIWCDSRAIASGQAMDSQIGSGYIQSNLLNNLGNFTASKLKWVKDNEKASFEKIAKVMLPGDFIAYKMTGSTFSSISGMSEGIFYDFENGGISTKVLEAIGISNDRFPELGSSFDVLGTTMASFEKITGISIGTPISYRAGDQPNNAFSLGVLDAGQAAGTGGTSGVVYAVSDQVSYDKKSRVNTFAHVNYSDQQKKYGTLMCINGTGILYNWIKSNFFADKTYNECEHLAQTIPSGSEGVMLYPFGNGAERILSNQQVFSSMHGLDFNRHSKLHMLRAGLEGIAFSFVYGLEIFKELGIHLQSMKVGNDNLFQSQVFSQTLVDVAQIKVEVIETTGAVGAAIGAGHGAGYINNLNEAFSKLNTVKVYIPSNGKSDVMQYYQNWKAKLATILN
jgi:xylulokinase